MRLTQIAIPLAVSLFAVACAAPAQTASTGSGAVAALRGKDFAVANCSQCHAIGDEGVSPVAAAPRWRELVMVRDIDGLAESFAEGSFVHSAGPVQMPEFTMTPSQIDDLLAYMRSLRPA